MLAGVQQLETAAQIDQSHAVMSRTDSGRLRSGIIRHGVVYAENQGAAIPFKQYGYNAFRHTAAAVLKGILYQRLEQHGRHHEVVTLPLHTHIDFQAVSVTHAHQGYVVGHETQFAGERHFLLRSIVKHIPQHV